MSERRVNDQRRPEIQTEEEFREAIRAAVLRAHENDVDVRGSWPIYSEAADWDVEITALADQ